MPHQSRVVNFARSNSTVRLMLCDEVGLGKTLEALGILDFLMVLKKSRPFIAVLVPYGTMGQSCESILHRRCYLIRNNAVELWIDGKFVKSVDTNSVQDEIWLYSSHWGEDKPCRTQ